MFPRNGDRSCFGHTRNRIKAAGGALWRVALAAALTLGLTLWFPTVQPQAAGTHYYLNSATGSDANPGTSPDRPWRSLNMVNSRQFQPGDVINFAAGSSWNGGLLIKSSGTADNRITYQAYGSGPKPVFSNSGQYSRSIQILGSWNVVKGLMVRDAWEIGVYIGPNATYNVVRECEATAVGIGFGVYGQHNTITNNDVHDLKMVVNTPGGDDDYGATAVLLANSYNEVSYNRMQRCRTSSYDYGMDGGTIEFYGNISGSYIHHNFGQDNNGFLEVGGGAAKDTIVAYNVSVNNGTFAWIHLAGNFASDVSNFRVENNTIIETAVSQNTYEVFGFSVAPSASTFILRNNIFYVNQYQYLSSKSGYAHDHNIFYFMQGNNTQLGTSLGGGDRIADPQFVNLNGGDYRLRAGSPAINAGVGLGYTIDYYGQNVPSGGAPDAGAAEYVAAAEPAPTAPPTATKGLLPTAAPTATKVLPVATATPIATKVLPVATATRAATAAPTRAPRGRWKRHLSLIFGAAPYTGLALSSPLESALTPLWPGAAA